MQLFSVYLQYHFESICLNFVIVFLRFNFFSYQLFWAAVGKCAAFFIGLTRIFNIY